MEAAEGGEGRALGPMGLTEMRIKRMVAGLEAPGNWSKQGRVWAVDSFPFSPIVLCCARPWGPGARQQQPTPGSDLTMSLPMGTTYS